MTLTIADRAWAAGFFDGEGCVHLAKGGGRYSIVRLTVNQVEPEVLHKFARIMDMGKVSGPYTGRGRVRSYYTYRISGKRVTEAMKIMWPYLGSIKRLQYQQKLDEKNQR